MTRKAKRYHRPKVYRYRVAVDGLRVGLNLRAGLNRCGHFTNGAYVLVGRYSYCVLWSRCVPHPAD